jgi:2,4-dienoyl-CoA reductase-like NADH-dependent reductase (Old Yellow Enzyme family)
MKLNRDAHAPFRLTSIEELNSAFAELGLDLEVADDTSALAKPSSFCIQPMEGCDAEADGSPGELTRRRYRRFAAGGAGMIWVEACAVTLGCRANPRQLCLTPQNKSSFVSLIAEIQRAAAESMGVSHRPFLVLQITHSGRYTRPDPVIAFHDPLLDPARGVPEDYPVITDGELEEIEEAFEASAKLAFEVGFDAVDVKSCHRYLINELLAAHTRPGNYGGSYENRTRFVKNVVKRIVKGLDGGGFEIPPHQVACRVNACDAHPYPYSWGTDQSDPTKPDFEEPKRLVRELCDLGVSLINVTAGNPYFSPHVNRPYDRRLPPRGVVSGQGCPETTSPLVGVARLLECAREIQQTVPEVPVVGSGLSWLRHFWPQAASSAIRGGWMQIVGLGRQAFAYPGFAKEIMETGALARNHVCVTCSRCSELMSAGKMVGCVPFDREVYGPLYEEMRGAR